MKTMNNEELRAALKDYVASPLDEKHVEEQAKSSSPKGTLIWSGRALEFVMRIRRLAVFLLLGTAVICAFQLPADLVLTGLLLLVFAGLASVLSVD
ncbi:MAG: hypothetical protein AAFQ34_12075 [Pseudomonadota bacterium]